MLTQTLRTLEVDGLLLRTVYPTRPPKVEYRLTARGKGAARHIKSLTDWVEENTPEIVATRSMRQRVQWDREKSPRKQTIEQQGC